MRRAILILILLAGAFYVNAQIKLEILVEEGISYHQQGDYQKAIELYQRALRLDSLSWLANYEIAFTYSTIGEHDKAIFHSDIVIANEPDRAMQAYNIKGSSLSNLERFEEAIALFERSLDIFGDYYLAHFNLGVVYFRMEDYDNAEHSFLNAIDANPQHPGSHLLLAHTLFSQGRRIESAIGLYYFMFLEPQSERARNAYVILHSIIASNITYEGESKLEIRISVPETNDVSEFSPVELMLAMVRVSHTLEANEATTQEEVFKNTTTSFFKILGELKSDDSEGLWWNYYVPFLSDVANSEHVEAFCHYISISVSEKSLEWLENNTEKLDDFAIWLRER